MKQVSAGGYNFYIIPKCFRSSKDIDNNYVFFDKPKDKRSVGQVK
jgi:hypothetical protein